MPGTGQRQNFSDSRPTEMAERSACSRMPATAERRSEAAVRSSDFARPRHRHALSSRTNHDSLDDVGRLAPNVQRKHHGRVLTASEPLLHGPNARVHVNRGIAAHQQSRSIVPERQRTGRRLAGTARKRMRLGIAVRRGLTSRPSAAGRDPRRSRRELRRAAVRRLQRLVRQFNCRLPLRPGASFE